MIFYLSPPLDKTKWIPLLQNSIISFTKETLVLQWVHYYLSQSLSPNSNHFLLLFKIVWFWYFSRSDNKNKILHCKIFFIYFVYVCLLLFCKLLHISFVIVHIILLQYHVLLIISRVLLNMPSLEFYCLYRRSII